jgi:RNA polymerase sigma-70 factor (sigma-E family)
MRGDGQQEYVEYVSARLPVLHRTAYLLCGDLHLADDIVQATTTALYVHWHRARAADNLDAYVHRTLFRKYLDEKRSFWARVRLAPSAPEVPARPSSTVEDRDLLQQALQRLPRTQRAVLVLRFLCDLSIDDVAEILRCSSSNVKSHTSRGLSALRQVLGVEETVN